MKQIKWGFLFLAIASAASIMGIGVAIGEESILGAILAIIIFIFCMGYGFTLKKKLREEGKL